MRKISRALLSVFDKRGIVEFARGLEALGVEILSTGGTYRELDSHGIAVTRVSDVTGFPEILGGRVKTLHPRIHGGILADRSKSEHATELAEHEISPIDLVAVNLYPFRQTASDPEASFDDIVEMIDIGGPCMVRAAAKNHRDVMVVVDPDDYASILELLQTGGDTDAEDLRRQLALKAFHHTGNYDRAVAGWLERRLESSEPSFPAAMVLQLEREFEPRYGENPHQQAALYRAVDAQGVFGGFEQLQGKELSFNNLLDTDAARRLVALVEEPAVVIVKHNNPCGVGRAKSLVEAYRRALECDPISAFGSIVACNRSVDADSAEQMKQLFIEVIVAPEFDLEAVEILATKKSLRLLSCPGFEATPASFDLRSVEGGMLAQTEDSTPDEISEWDCPTRRQPTDQERSALELAWKVVRQVKSNAIVIGNQHQTVGIGAGQMSRVDACRLAVEKAKLETSGCVAASDAFFPFADGLEVLAEAGVRAIVEPGGSKRDSEVVAAANEHDIAILMTGRRHFKH
jgi:phosphoribosylaminoimidazolecarboxamide formyltransferase/IMP cyclohydrolase